MTRELHERNRKSWNAATEVHLRHRADRAELLRNGGSSLMPEELELLGDVSGLRLVHLQCNAGEDSLSLAARGATVTGVDISDYAIEAATRLAGATGIPGRFVRADIYEWLTATAGQERFDLAFSSYGALCWLSDLGTWARGIAGILVPNGRLVVIDNHPLLLMFDDDWQFRYPYQGGTVVETAGVPDYVGSSKFVNPHPDFTFQWGVGDILSALLAAGLVIEVVREYPFANHSPCLRGIRDANNRWWPPEDKPRLPAMLGFSARLS